MSYNADELWKLLPAHLRTRDAELANPDGPDAQGRWKPGPLQELIGILAGQIRVIEAELDQLYDNHFVETAAPWALPYLGDLLGIRGLPTHALARSPRAEIGHTVVYRRRKGTAPILELLARDITGWPARAIEFFERLAATQHLNHTRLDGQSFARLRDPNALELVGTAFETLQRTVEVRRAASGRGRWNIPNVGLFLWPLTSFSRTASPIVPTTLTDDEIPGRRFRLHPLGFDLPLQVRPVTEDDVTHLADPINVPLPLTRRLLAPVGDHPVESLYGPGLSVALEIWTGTGFELVPRNRLRVCDLSDATHPANGNPVWNHELLPTGDQVALDPVLGRVVFGTAPSPNPGPRATYHFGFSGPIGGGEYGRLGSLDSHTDAPMTVAQTSAAMVTTVAAAINPPTGASSFIQMLDSGRYLETLPQLNANAPLEISAIDEKCPTLLLQPGAGNQPWILSGDPNGSITLNGLWLAGALRADGDLARLIFRHCTLVPNVRVGTAGEVAAAAAIPLEIAARRIQVEIENCVLPPLRVGVDGVRVRMRNCIVDAGDVNQMALSNLDGTGPAGTWRLENCTIRGKVELDSLDLATNCLFVGSSLMVRRRQEGCVRFSYLPADSRAPRQFRCLTGVGGAAKGLHPQFTSFRFGHRGYGELSRRTPAEIRTGADDGSEMGVFHDLFRPQREEHLRVRLHEYLRFGLEAGVFFEPNV